MRLNRTSSSWTELERDKLNENWRIIEGLGGKVDNIVDEISDEAFDKIVDSAKLDWKNPVDSFEDLPSSASEGETRMVRDTGKVYRFNGLVWQEIQQIDVSPINEVDSRLTTQLADTDEFRHQESMISRKLPREPMITIEDDDGWIGFYTVLYELAKEYNIPMTSAMITSRAMSFPGDNRPQRPQNYNYEQVMEMQESGLIEFVSHSHNHERLSEMSEEDIREDFNTTQNFMKKYGFNHRAITIPFGDYGNREIGIIKEFFDYSTGGIKEKTIVKQPANNYLLGRISSELPFSELEQYMDEAVAEDGWLIICTHVGQDSDSSKEYYESIIQSALSKGLKFVKLEEGIKHHGNIAQFGGTNREPATTISSDDVYGKLLGRVRYAERNEGIDANTPITEFQKNTITFTDINTPSADGFPGNFPGILYTHRYTEIPYSRQTYITSRDYKEFVRMWDVDNNKWGDWVTTGTVQYLGLNAIKATDHPTSFNLQRKISVTQIDSRGNDGFPNNESGLLFNYALHSGTVFPFQEYKVFRRFL